LTDTTTDTGLFVSFRADTDQVTARTGQGLPAAALTILTDTGFTATDTPNTYRLTGPDAVQRAARAAYYLSAADIGIEDPDQRGAGLTTDSPDVAFSHHPHAGVIAATSEDGTAGLAAQTLQRFGWRYDGRPQRDIYLAPEDATESEALTAAARATRALQALGYRVSAQGLTAAPPAMAALAEAASDLATERANVADLVDTRDIADVLSVALDPKVGALPQLSQLLSTVSEWCTALPEEDGIALTSLLGDLTHEVTQLSTGLAQAQRSLTAMNTALPVIEPHADTVVHTTADPDLAPASVRATAARSSSVSRLATGPVAHSATPSRAETPAAAPHR